MGKKKNKAGKPANAEEVTEQLQTPVEKRDSKVENALKEIEKLENFGMAYQEGIKMTKYHLQQCQERTGEILMVDVEYCLDLAKRMAVYSIN